MKPIILGAAALALTLALAGCAPKVTPHVTTVAPSPAATTPADTAAAAKGDEAFSTDEGKIKENAQYVLKKAVAAVDFTLTDLDGKTWKLSDLKGKIVLLNFWATWCGPCQAEMPDFQHLQDLNRDDLVILAVASTALESQDEKASREGVSKFIQQQKYTFPVPFDADGSVWGTYQQSGVPTNYIIGKDGNVRYLRSGRFYNSEDMMAALEAVRRLDGQ